MSTQLSAEIVSKLDAAGINNQELLQSASAKDLMDLAQLTAKEALLVKAVYPTATVEVTVDVGASSGLPEGQGRRNRQNRLLAAAAQATAFSFNAENVLKLGGIYAVRGQEIAQLDWLVWRHLNQGAGRYIQNDWLLQVTNDYREGKKSGSRIHLPRNPEMGIEWDRDLQIVSEQERVSYWNQMEGALEKCGFYTLIAQLAYWARAEGKAERLEKFSNVMSTMSDARYDPEQMNRLHQQVLTGLSVFMEDRTRELTAIRLQDEQDLVVLPTIEDEDFLRQVVAPPRDVDPLDYFWKTDKLDLSMERAALRLGLATHNVIEALADYDPSLSYAEQMDKYATKANEMFTVLEEMGGLIPHRYTSIPKPQEGVAGIFATLRAAINIRVKVGNTTVQVEASVGVQARTQIPTVTPVPELLVNQWNYTLRGFRDQCAELFVSEASARAIVDEAGMNSQSIDFEQSADNRWHSIVKHAINQTTMPALLAVVFGRFPEKFRSYIVQPQAQAPVASTTVVNTGRGAYVAGNVNVENGNFTGGDSVTYNN